MSVLVFGRRGQVATELQYTLPNGIFLGREQADLSDPEICAQAIRDHAPTAVINAAAYTAVDRAEDEETLAQTVNGEAPGAMARACAELGIPFVHISTDYVFDGQGDTPWTPADPVAPLSAYGRTKLAGERAIEAAGGQWVILRTSWVFSAHGGNLVKTMLRLSETRDALNVVADQIGGPTPARDIATACAAVADKLRDGAPSGIHHFGGTPAVSWADFARAIFAMADRDVAVTDIPASDYPTPAARPANSRLDGTSLQQTFGIAPPDWQDGLGQVLKELS